jgi:excisionase family DNA binding protein
MWHDDRKRSRRAPLDDVLTPDEVADFLKIPKSTLYSWRHRSSGPSAMRVGRHLRYRMRDVEAYLDGLARDQENDRSNEV